MLLLWILLLAGPPEAERLYSQGVALMEQGRAAEAAEKLEAAARLAVKKAQYWKALGAARARTGDYAAAAGPFHRACDLEPGLEDACYFEGRALYAGDRYREALAPLEKALRADRVKARAETALGQCREALGEAAEAERLYRHAVGRNDAFAQGARQAYGLFLIRQGRPEEAVPPLEAAQMPETGEGRYRLGWAYAECERLGEAERALRRATELDAGHEAARLLLEKVRRRAALRGAPTGPR